MKIFDCFWIFPIRFKSSNRQSVKTCQSFPKGYIFGSVAGRCLLTVLAMLVFHLSFIGQNIQALQQQFLSEKDKGKKVEIALKIADHFYTAQNYKDALHYAEKGFELDPNSYLSHFKAAQVHVAEKHFALALDSYIKSEKIIKNLNEVLLLAELNAKIGDLYHAWEVPEKSIDSYKSALIYYEKTDKKEDHEVALVQKLALNLVDNNRHEEAILIFKKGLIIAQEHKNTIEHLYYLQKIGDAYKVLGNIKEALEVNKEILGIYELKGDEKSVALTHNNLGFLHKQINEYDEALAHFKEAFNYYKSQNYEDVVEKERLAVLQANMAILYQNKKDFDNALKNFKEVVDIRRSMHDDVALTEALNFTGMVYFALGELQSAKKLLEEGEAMLANVDAPKVKNNNFNLLSMYYKKKMDYKRALDYYQLAVNEMNKLKSIDEQRLKEERERAKEADKKEGELKFLMMDQDIQGLALSQLKLESEKREKELDLLRRKEEMDKLELERSKLEKSRAQQALLLAQQNLESEKKAKEINLLQKDKDLLQKDKDLQELELQQKELKDKERKKEIELLNKENKLKELKIGEEQFVKKIFGVIIAIIVIFLIFVIRSYIQKQKANREILKQKEQIEGFLAELEIKNEVIEEKNKLHMDSLAYAERIQRVVLPSDNLMKDLFNNVFTLFRPKDIVSGDFYYAADLEDGTQLFAAVDCTGHGVPGAFMSLLCHGLMEKIVNQGKIYNPGEILQQLSLEVHRTLGAQGETNSGVVDGMDIAIIKLDKKNHKLIFSGARNGVVMIRDGEVTEYKGDRRDVGDIEFQEVFKTYEVDLKNGDTLYMFTDGYQDQRGGEKGAKIYNVGFRNILKDVNNMPIDKQLPELESRLIKWRGNMEQMDDVLVFGMRYEC